MCDHIFLFNTVFTLINLSLVIGVVVEINECISHTHPVVGSN